MALSSFLTLPLESFVLIVMDFEASSMVNLYALIASLPIKKAVLHSSTTWNSTHRSKTCAFLLSPDNADVLGRYTGNSTNPSTFVFELPIPLNDGDIGDSYIG